MLLENLFTLTLFIALLGALLLLCLGIVHITDKVVERLSRKGKRRARRAKWMRDIRKCR
jgi:hypothetical protein